MPGGSKPPFNPYEVLGLEPSCTSRDVKHSYHRLARKSHPDVGASDNSTFEKITRAYHILLDPFQRQLYDTYGDKSIRAYATVSEKPGFDFASEVVSEDSIRDLVIKAMEEEDFVPKFMQVDITPSSCSSTYSYLTEGVSLSFTSMLVFKSIMNNTMSVYSLAVGCNLDSRTAVSLIGSLRPHGNTASVEVRRTLDHDLSAAVGLSKSKRGLGVGFSTTKLISDFISSSFGFSLGTFSGSSNIPAGMEWGVEFGRATGLARMRGRNRDHAGITNLSLIAGGDIGMTGTHEFSLKSTKLAKPGEITGVYVSSDVTVGDRKLEVGGTVKFMEASTLGVGLSYGSNSGVGLSLQWTHIPSHCRLSIPIPVSEEPSLSAVIVASAIPVGGFLVDWFIFRPSRLRNRIANSKLMLKEKGAEIIDSLLLAKEEQEHLRKQATDSRTFELDHSGLVIDEAYYGFCVDKHLSDADEQPEEGEGTHIAMLSSMGVDLPLEVEVSIPLQASIFQGRLRIAGSSEGLARLKGVYLPRGLHSLDTNEELHLYVKYRYRGQEYEALFPDRCPISLP